MKKYQKSEKSKAVQKRASATKKNAKQDKS